MFQSHLRSEVKVQTPRGWQRPRPRPGRPGCLPRWRRAVTKAGRMPSPLAPVDSAGPVCPDYRLCQRNVRKYSTERAFRQANESDLAGRLSPESPTCRSPVIGWRVSDRESNHGGGALPAVPPGEVLNHRRFGKHPAEQMDNTELFKLCEAPRAKGHLPSK